MHMWPSQWLEKKKYQNSARITHLLPIYIKGAIQKLLSCTHTNYYIIDDHIDI